MLVGCYSSVGQVLSMLSKFSPCADHMSVRCWPGVTCSGVGPVLTGCWSSGSHFVSVYGLY